MWRHFLALGILSLIVGGWLLIRQQPQDQALTRIADDHYRFVTKPCWFVIPWPADIVCGELHTPIASGGFKLPVVRLRDHSINHRSDPVIYLPGGPGGSARLDE